ncbi:diguanylate cyclase [Halioxenophilus sp. WMMB6]|uniref:sensor domain-containing diguanylate cyclase n=1 Tax=Halioxenophilus sp. WMMB6 TaxID=3073815 RepID=UPI00295ED0FF|nr:diguanylate cyclase [Halioxenophilus sp. WMMB6]
MLNQPKKVPVAGNSLTPVSSDSLALFDADERNMYVLVDQCARIVACNKRVAEQLGRPKAEVPGVALYELFADSEYQSITEPALAACMAGEVTNASQRFRLDSESPEYVGYFEVSYLPVALDSGEPGILVTCHDVTRLKQNERKLRQLAHLDPLTQLPNLRFIDYQLRKLQSLGLREGRGFTVVFIDFDQFKYINDVYGHLAGDQVLIEFSRRLRGKLRGGEHIGRIGGDEFLIVIREALQESQQRALSRRLKEIVARPFEVGNGDKVLLGISVGSSVWPIDGDSLEDLKRLADERMYANKPKS